MTVLQETFREGRCIACGVEDTCIVLAGQLLCGACDSLGRIAAARQAYQVEKHRQAVMQGYQRNQVKAEGKE